LKHYVNDKGSWYPTSLNFLFKTFHHSNLTQVSTEAYNIP